MLKIRKNKTKHGIFDIYKNKEIVGNIIKYGQFTNYPKYEYFADILFFDNIDIKQKVHNKIKQNELKQYLNKCMMTTQVAE